MEYRTPDRWFRVTEQALDTGAVDQAVRDERAGGVCVFVGTTRRFTDGAETTELRYDAYPQMALDEMERLATYAGGRWPLLRVAIHHRTGVVAPGEASVVIAVATPHRAEAFAACRYLIDELKERVPIWKQESWADGTTEWVEGGGPDR